MTRSLPHDTTAETTIVGGILVHAKALAEVGELVDADDFQDPALATVFKAITALDEIGRPIDLGSVWQQLVESGDADKLRARGGQDLLVAAMGEVVTVENLPYHARKVRVLATVRRVAMAAQAIAARAFGDLGDPDDFLQDAESQIVGAVTRRQETTFEQMAPILKRVVQTIENRYEHKGEITGVATNYDELDLMTGGFQPGDLVIIAARPSMGKTSLVMEAITRAAVHHQVPGLVFSLEMSKESLVERMISSRGRIMSQNVRQGRLSVDDWTRIAQASSDLSVLPISIDDSASPTLVEIRAKARRWRAQNPVGLGVVAVDYLQLIKGRPSKDDNRQREIAEITRGLKALAKELKVPVIALSQLNRSVETRADKRPMMSDLRESGAIEQDADVIAFIYRDEVYSKDQCKEEDKGVAEVIVGKQRNGPTGTVRLAFLNIYTRFENLKKPEEAPLFNAPHYTDTDERDDA